MSNPYRDIGHAAQKLSHNPVGIIFSPIWVPTFGVGIIGLTTGYAVYGSVMIAQRAFAETMDAVFKIGSEIKEKVSDVSAPLGEKISDFKSDHQRKHGHRIHQFFSKHLHHTQLNNEVSQDEQNNSKHKHSYNFKR
ncbi:MAG: hypothetical protein H0W64_10190 [Gammaproteobacteria bacterium]|nr:hypothetical protein [Gammaproteobacteria bacterium]